MATMNKPCYAAIKSHSPSKPVLIFISSRRQTRLTAIDLISFICRDHDSASVQSPFLNIDVSEMGYVLRDVKDSNLKHALAFGIGLHHAGLHPSDRKIVDQLYLKNSIQVLIATSTLAWGVNLPAHLVIIKGTEYFDASIKRYVQLPITDILQMIGRAGRPQFDTHAVAVVLVHSSKKQFYKKFLYHSFPVESNLHTNMCDHINAEIAVGTLSNIQDCIDYLSWTFLFRRLIKNPTYYQLENIEANSINEYLRDMIRSTLWDLNDSKCIEFLDEDQNVFETTVSGEIASYYYLKHETMSIFNESLNDKCTINDLLRILSFTKEYDELPVRHNEEKLNYILAQQVRYSVNDLSFDEPSTKANLLFQAHFDRLELPITDYITDLQSVLDQCIRILQAMIDFISKMYFENGLQSIINIINLLQMVTQGRWLDDSTLLNIPHITNECVLYLWNKYNIECLAELLALKNNRIYAILNEFNESDSNENENKWSEDELNKMMDVIVNGYPRVSANVMISQECLCNVGYNSKAIDFIVKLRRHSGNGHHVYSPKWYKSKLEGWFIIITLHESNSILCIKRVRVDNVTEWRKNKISVKLAQNKDIIRKYITNQRNNNSNSNDNNDDSMDTVELEFDIYFLSDSYLGLDQFYTVSCLFDASDERKQMENKKGSDDPFANIDTVDDLISLKQRYSYETAHSTGTQSIAQRLGYQPAGGSGASGVSNGHQEQNQEQQDSNVQASSALSEVTEMDVANLDLSNIDLASAMDDARSIMTQETQFEKWD